MTCPHEWQWPLCRALTDSTSLTRLLCSCSRGTSKVAGKRLCSITWHVNISSTAEGTAFWSNAINSSLLCVSCFLAQPRCCLLFLSLEEGTNATQELLTTEKIHPVTGPLLFHSMSQALSCRDCSTSTSPPSKDSSTLFLCCLLSLL